MTISDTQKVDLLFKKVGFGLTKTDTSDNKSPANESIASEIPTYAQDIWAEADSIPATAPSSDSSIVEVKTDANGNDFVTLTQDGTATPNRTWLTNLRDWIPFSFGSTYAVKVYAGATFASATQLFPDGSGNNDEWFFDYQAGVLNFIGDNLPSGVAGNNVYLEGFRYIGAKGIASASNVTFRTFADIAARDASGDVNSGDLVRVDDNGDGEYAVYIANADGPTTNFTLVSTEDSAGGDSKTLKATVTPTSGTVVLGNISGFSRVVNVSVENVTEFDGSTAEIQVGTSANPDVLMEAAQNDPHEVGGIFITTPTFCHEGATDLDLQVVVTQGNATTGSIDIQITFA